MIQTKCLVMSYENIDIHLRKITMFYFNDKDIIRKRNIHKYMFCKCQIKKYWREVVPNMFSPLVAN